MSVFVDRSAQADRHGDSDPGDGESRPVAALVVTSGWAIGGPRYTCDGINQLDHEIGMTELYLDDIGVDLDVLYEDRRVGITYDELATYDLVIYNNGGFSAPGSLVTVEALEQLADDGMSLLFMGNDSAYHAYRTQLSLGTDALFDLMYLAGPVDNGIPAGVGAVVVDDRHRVTHGWYGDVEDFDYVGDFDVSRPAGLGESVLMVRADDGTSPVVLAAKYRGQRTVMAQVSLYSSGSACPATDADGLDQIEVLFKNAATWLIDAGD